ncbi:MAG: transcriptional regulator, LuxR family protein [Rhizorhabdus sp.]|nr:transcriptional regulator, LuxR family protein [Rhizorhabdus sp.]
MAYAAALDDSLWERWAEEVTVAMGGVGGTFMVWNDRRTIRMSRAFAADPVAYDEYLTHQWQHDPQVPVAMAMKRSGFYVDADHLDLNDRATADYMKWQDMKAGWYHHVTGVALLGKGGARATICIHRSKSDGPVPVRDRARFASIFPDTIRAMNMGFRFAQMLEQSFWDGLIDDPATEAALLLGEDGAVIRQTAAAEALFAQGDELTVRARRLGCREPDLDDALSAVIGNAMCDDGARSGAVRVPRKPGQSPLLIVAYPVVRSHRLLAPSEAAAIVRIIDLGDDGKSRHDLYRQAFGLSPREAETAVLLMNGHSVESAAACLNLSALTVRIHVRNLLAKTGTARQAELVRVLSRLR